MYFFYANDKYINFDKEFKSYKLDDWFLTLLQNINKFDNNEHFHLTLKQLFNFITVFKNNDYILPYIDSFKEIKQINNHIPKFAINALTITTASIKKETATGFENLNDTTQLVINAYNIEKCFNTLISIIKNNKQLEKKDYNVLIDCPFKKQLERLYNFFDSNGNFTFTLIEDTPYSKFAHGKAFAMYYKGGFFSSTGTAGADIVNAKLFQNLPQIKRYAKDFRHYALVEVDVKFSKIVEVNNENITLLNDMISEKEKIQIQEQLDKPYEDLDELSLLLVNVSEPEKIKEIILNHRKKESKTAKKTLKL